MLRAGTIETFRAVTTAQVGGGHGQMTALTANRAFAFGDQFQRNVFTRIH